MFFINRIVLLDGLYNGEEWGGLVEGGWEAGARGWRVHGGGRGGAGKGGRGEGGHQCKT